MYVWRFPLVSFAILVTTAVLVLGLSLVLAARRRTANVLLRAILLSVGIAGVAASSVVVYAIAEIELRGLIELGVFKHYGVPRSSLRRSQLSSFSALPIGSSLGATDQR